MRLVRVIIFTWVLAFAIHGTSTALAQPARLPDVTSAKCLLVDQNLGRLLSNLKLGRCTTGCTGCGCKGGPGYRDAKGDCASYENVNRLCGPPPHRACTAECMPVHPACLAHGRVAAAGLALAQGATLLWADRDPALPPVEFPPATGPERKTLQSPALVSAIETRANTDSWRATVHQCGAKQYCYQMQSCEEAMFHFEQCGLIPSELTPDALHDPRI